MVAHVETPLIPPPGKKLGCLERIAPFGKLFKPMAETVKVLSWDEIRDRIDPVLSNRPYVDARLDQDGVGSCAFEMTAGAVMTSRKKRGEQHVLLNPWSGYCYTSGGVDRGSNVDANMRFAKDSGILPMAVWPRSMGWRKKPPQELYDRFGVHFRPDEVYDIKNTREVATALIEQRVVGFGWQGHSCLLVELLDKDTALYANSWGADWGDDGFGVIKLRSINFGYGAHAVRTTTICPQSVYDDIAEYAHKMGYANVG